MYGGAALNAAHALLEALSGVLPRGGRLPEPLNAGVIAPSEAELESWRSLQPGVDALAGQGGRPADPAAADEFYLRTWARPALDVNGLAGGSPYLQKTVLPALAEANLSIRLVAGQDTGEIADAVIRLLRAAAPAGADVEVEVWALAPPGLVEPGSPAIQLGLGAFERALGVRPLLLRSGGSLPIVPALGERGIPTVITGFALPESNVHSPNERLRVEDVDRAVAAATELYRTLAQLA
jgi:acetylornithine deacetylase/succinyl-diaminopimelate desuccinylase-like protein